ncbi:ice-binding family protein [Prosthecobacter sp.]|uniref:autotransporter domain-containing protein n=1 Tax=Prosthecobacter sp. TaxID=1965333 RepID=UPI002489A29C|nr:ice-binding family protein [Prosthecobacter sp.]MDI1313296.1 autotransporter domain-containing protein [Prosthecobacter sp.]
MNQHCNEPTQAITQAAREAASANNIPSIAETCGTIPEAVWKAVKASLRGCCRPLFFTALLALPLTQAHGQLPPSLGAASTFTILGGSTVTNTGGTNIVGDVGVYPGFAITGFPPGTVIGTIYAGIAPADTAHADTITAYNTIATTPFTNDLTGIDLGGLTLTPGVYFFSSSAQLTGNLHLDTLGDPNALFEFQVGSTLTTSSLSTVSTVGGGIDPNIFWQIGSSATLGIGTSFMGNILAMDSITLTTGASLSGGRALAITGAVTLDTNNVSNVGSLLPLVVTGTYWNGGTSDLWSQINWSTDTSGADTVNMPLAGANLVFSVTGIVPIRQATQLDFDADISSLTVNDSVAVSISGTNTLTISGAGLITGISINPGAGLTTIATRLILAGTSQTITVNNLDGMVISGVVDGTLGLTKAGSGTLTLTGANIYTGATNVNAGTLQVGNSLTGSLNATSLVTVATDATMLIDLANGGTFSNNVVNDGLVQWIAPGTNTQASTSVITGVGRMAITGAGTTVLLGSNLFSGGTTVNTPGNVLVGNPLGATSTAFGTGVLTLTNGNVDTFNSQVLQINVGGYSQTGGQIGIHLLGATPGTYTQYNVTGAGNLTGGAVAPYDLSGVYVPSGGDVQNFLHTTGGLTGQFPSNFPAAPIYNTAFNQIFVYQQGSTLLYPQITYDPNNAYLTWVQSSFQTVPGLTPNQGAVATLLDQCQLMHPGGGDPALTYLNAQNIGALPGLYDQIAPDELTAIFQAGFQAAAAQATTVKQHLDQVRNNANGYTANGFNPSSGNPNGAPVGLENQRWSFYVQGLGNGASANGTANASGYSFMAVGGTVGASYLVNNHFVVGASGTYSDTTASLTNGGSIQMDSYRSNVYASVFGGGFYLDALMGLSYNSYDTIRSSLLGMATGGTNGVQFDSMLNGGYDFHADNWMFGPVVSLGYTQVNLNDFTESGSLTPLNFPNQYQSSLRSNLGIRVSFTTMLKSVRITPQLRLSWQHEYLDNTQSITSQLALCPGSMFSVSGPMMGRDSALVNIGLTAQITPMVSAYAFYGGQFGSTNYTSHSVNAGVMISF